MKLVFLAIITAVFGGAEAAESDDIIADVTKDLAEAEDLLAAVMVVSPPNRMSLEEGPKDGFQQHCIKRNGLVSKTPGWNACCPATCGSCGGSACGQRPGGSAHCCPAFFSALDRVAEVSRCDATPSLRSHVSKALLPCVEVRREDDLAEAELWSKASDIIMHASVEDDVVESPVTTDLDVTLSTEHDASAFDWEHSILDFLHVPKSGGSVVKQILWGWGEERQKRIVGHEIVFGDLSKEEQDHTIAIWGHRGYGVHLQPGFKTSKNVKYFTILRDPLARIISQYEFAKKNWAKRIKKSPPMGPFIEWFRNIRSRDIGSPWHASQSPNVQQLCCWWNWNPNWDHDRKPPIPNCPASAETLECAKKHIMDFVMVGIQEEFDDSVSLLLWKTGMRDNRGAIKMRENTFRGEKKYVPTPAEEAEVRASSAWDYALYAFAKEKLHTDILEMKTKQK